MISNTFSLKYYYAFALVKFWMNSLLQTKDFCDNFTVTCVKFHSIFVVFFSRTVWLYLLSCNELGQPVKGHLMLPGSIMKAENKQTRGSGVF